MSLLPHYKIPNSELITIQQLFQRWEAEHGVTFPNNYICFDMETTGFDMNDDLLVELGSCRVVDGSADVYESHVIDWTQSEYVDDDWLEDRILRCQKQMAKAGRQCHMTMDRIRNEGHPPAEVLNHYLNQLNEAKAAGDYVVGHNLIVFDAPRFSQAVKEWLGVDFLFDARRVLDTAALEKAAQIGSFPYANEGILEYFRRILSTPVKGVRFNLDVHCVQKYGLTEKYDLDMNDAHTAGFDAMLVHLLLEEFREIKDYRSEIDARTQ